MKSIAFILMILAIISFVIGYVKKYQNCPKKEVNYKYIPKSFYKEQYSKQNLKKKFNNMFKNKSVWSSYPINSID